MNTRKKFFRFLRRSRSNPHLPVESGISEIQPSSIPLSINESPRRSPGSIRKFFSKVIKGRSAPGVRQSRNPEPAAASSSVPDFPPSQTTQDPSPSTAPSPEQNPDQSSNLDAAKVEQPDPEVVNERISNATKGMAGIKNVPVIVQNTASATNNLQSIPDTVDTFSAILTPLKAFNTVANRLADVHPYAKVALSIFTCASKMILDQADLDTAVSCLLTKISEVYTFITEDEALAKIPSMPDIYGKIARQTLECADFITHYSQTTSAWRRLGKHVFDETNTTVQSYNKVLDSLMQQFRDRAARDTVIIVHSMAETLDLVGMPDRAAGAGVNPSKCCLPNTRQEILTDIENWISSTDESAPRILWLSGTAGKGKSAIAHTIAKRYAENGGLGSCFCFDRTSQTDRRQDKIFFTIARELAGRNPIVRRALAKAVHGDDELKYTSDLTRQWKELIVGPTSIASEAITAPVLIVIEALDESGGANSREQILRLLAGKLNTSTSQLTEIPANFRVLVTSRPLEDIKKALCIASHVRHVSLDDISSTSAERDIQLYISNRLDVNVFNDAHCERLAQKSDGMFEWARLICEYINGTNRVGLDPMDRFEAIVAGTSEKGTRLLDSMYALILTEIMPEDERGEAIPVFRSVMGQILASLEPLPVPALTAMRPHFPPGACRYKVDRVIGPLGSLLTGTADSQTPIRPLHASFYDFLTDNSRSHDFFIDTSSVQSDLAFVSLRVMEHRLRFNICSLESSYVPNSAVPDLEKRVKDSIPTELSYSCRFWGTHLGTTSFQPALAKEVEAFLDGERLLWWLEALSLMKSLSGSAGSLLSIIGWVTGRVKYTHIADTARDTLRFVRTFAPTILHSTPHLYLSALPFAPTQSKIFCKFAAKFPCTPRIVAGRVLKWPQMEKILHGRARVYSVAMSPDGTRIVCGLEDGTIQMWDMETGETLGAPLQGHTDFVRSVAISRDGKCIVSGSDDATVRVWDLETGKALGAPLLGHTDYVRSVAITRDGKYIVSGSNDKTVRVWDMETGKALGAPLKGHTKWVYCVAISLDGKHIVSGSRDKTIRVWDMETGEALGVPLHGHTDAVNSVTVSPDRTHIISGSSDKTIRVWDVETGQASVAPLQGHTNSVHSVVISSDGNCIMSGSLDQTIRVWDLKTGKSLGSPLRGHSSSVLSVVISPDGNRIVSGSHDQTIRVWGADTSTGEASGAALQGHTASINSVVISPDEHHIVSGSSDKTVRVWDMGTGEALVAPLQGHTGSIWSVAISPNGHHVVSGSSDKSIRMWDMGTGEALGAPLQGHTRDVTSVAFSLDGTCIVSGSYDNTVRLCNVATGKALHAPLQGHTADVNSIAISRDGNCIVSGSDDKTVRVWDMETGKALHAPLEGHTSFIMSVAISLDGKRIVSGSRDNTIRVWDMGTGEALGAALQGHTANVNSVVISSDGNHIASGSSDMTIRVWDMETGEPVGAPLRGHTGPVWSVAISPDRKHIVSGSSDKTIRVWDVEFLTQHQPFEAPAISFSSNPAHALHSASSFLQDSSTSSSLATNKEGWVVGPDGRLLLWIPLNFHPVMYAPGNTLVIPTQASQFDLSCLAHGTSWYKCREQKAALSS